MRARTALLVATLVYITAWFLPSISLPGWPESASRIVLRGWASTRSALSPVWPSGLEWESPILALLAVASAMTNVLFVLSVAFALWKPHRVPHWLAWAVGGGALVNVHWLIPDARFRSWLRAGYYAWVASFMFLALALHWTRREHPAAAPALPAA